MAIYTRPRPSCLRGTTPSRKIRNHRRKSELCMMVKQPLRCRIMDCRCEEMLVVGSSHLQNPWSVRLSILMVECASALFRRKCNKKCSMFAKCQYAEACSKMLNAGNRSIYNAFVECTYKSNRKANIWIILLWCLSNQSMINKSA
jgi:hypothetical protein